VLSAWKVSNPASHQYCASQQLLHGHFKVCAIRNRESRPLRSRTRRRETVPYRRSVLVLAAVNWAPRTSKTCYTRPCPAPHHHRCLVPMARAEQLAWAPAGVRSRRCLLHPAFERPSPDEELGRARARASTLDAARSRLPGSRRPCPRRALQLVHAGHPALPPSLGDQPAPAGA